MPDKLTDNEIIKALECCLGDSCYTSECSFFEKAKDGEHCQRVTVKHAFDLINCQEQKHKELWEERNRIYESFKETSEELEEYRKAYVNQQAENESLKAENEELRKKVNFLQASNNLNQSLLEKRKIEVELAKAETEKAKAEAYKEIIELAKSRKRIVDVSPTFGYEVFEEVVTIKDIYNLLNELVGEEK